MEEPTDQTVHRGYEFEEGMFSRVRSWCDVAPWIRLGRVVRVLSSLPYVLAFFLFWALMRLVVWASQSAFGLFLGLGSPMSYSENALASTALLPTWSGLIVLFLAGIPVFLFVARAGVVITAGHPPPPVGLTLRLIRQRLLRSYVLPLVPVSCLLVFGTLAYLVRLPAMISTSSQWDWFIGGLLGLACLPFGLLGFGALVAIPLGLVAMIAEPDPDPIDSLSRGYEYLYRRPLHLVFYAVVSCVLVAVMAALLTGICGVAREAALRMSGNPFESLGADWMIGVFLEAWLGTLLVGLTGGAYLLLRYNASDQEVEDIYFPASPLRESLPELPKEAYES
ncbi:MAG: hypothetical protein AAGJ83_09590 [Planctomycetota bacterium]